MGEGNTFVGLDVHKNKIQVAVLHPDSNQAEEFQLKNTPHTIERMVKKLHRGTSGLIHCCYEAGPCGYVIQRQLYHLSHSLGARISCEVIAPSLIPRKPGERIKTDRRDALKLAKHLRAGLLTEVHPPTPAEESVRDLVRCREAAKADLQRSRHRLQKFLLRRGIVYRGTKTSWTAAHFQWLRGLKWETVWDRRTFEDYLMAVEQLRERIRRLDRELEDLSLCEPYATPVGWLRCFRGIDTLTAMTILAELPDFRRFPSPRTLMSFVGLIPGEYSSGERQRRGGITKTGNRHVRRVLIEAAWHYRLPVNVGGALKRRRAGQPTAVISMADLAQQRLHDRYWRLTMAGKPANKAVTAVARELVGFIWALLFPWAVETMPLEPETILTSWKESAVA